MSKKQSHKRKLGAYPATTVVLSLTLALFVVGWLLSLLLYMTELKRAARENVEIGIAVKIAATEAEKLDLKNTLEEKDYIRRSNGEAAIRYVSRQAAAEELVAELEEDFLETMESNPLPAYYYIKLKENWYRHQPLSQIRNQLSQHPAVKEVFYPGAQIQKLNQNIGRVFVVLLVLIGVLFLTIFLLVNNTIRLAVYSQRFLIRSMQLVGATPRVIIGPFVRRSVVLGLVGGLLASVLVLLTHQLAFQQIPELAQLRNPLNDLLTFAAMVLLGVLLAGTAVYFAVRRFLHRSLDQLY